MGLVLEL